MNEYRAKARKCLWAMALGLLAAAGAQAAEVHFEPVAEGVYAFIGETGPRTVANEGLNANIGLVLTPQGALLIDSGATFEGARQIHAAVRRVTTEPVRWVINTGGQDHRWLGNGYFKTLGAELIAHASAEADMLNRGNDQLQSLRLTLGSLADGTQPVLPSRWVAGQNSQLTLGSMTVELRHRGGAHTPGDMLVWLPERGVLFSGDVVYVDRMLGVLPMSQTRQWLATFAAMEELQPARIVPGHGQVCSLEQARRQTRDYLHALREHMREAVEQGQDISVAVRSFDTTRFLPLLNAAELMPGNASRTYLEVERE